MREAMAVGRGGRGGRADVSALQSSPRGSGRCGGEGKGEDREFDKGKGKMSAEKDDDQKLVY